MPFGRQERQRRRFAQHDPAGQLVRQRLQNLRVARDDVGDESNGCTTMPASTSGPAACRPNSNSVTMPKLPPPPRIAQKRSAFSFRSTVHVLPDGGDDVGRQQIVDGEAEFAASSSRTRRRA